MFLLVAVASLMVFASVAANGQSVAIVTENNNCLIPDGNRNIMVFKCTDGGIRYTVDNGFIKTADGYCFDHGVSYNMTPNNSNAGVKLVRCNSGNKSQQWYIIGSGRGVGLVQNAVNPKVCLNISGGNDRPGGQVIVWGCGYNNPGANERFYFGGAMSASQRRNIPYAGQVNVNKGGSLTFSNGTRMVAAGGGNIVAAGAGNMVAAGGGNIVAAGAGNLIGLDGSTLVNRLVGNDGASIRGLSGMSMRP